MFRPQQAIVPSVLIPQVCASPALTALYVPAATVVRLLPLSPQHEIAPALLKAQVWMPPALTALKLPA